ncbi:MAG: carboxypeptidase-like regulatory domain-containing protein [Candidatus Aminicenantes bacterium]|nr:carboxypeptidase-like regulatory domain-containing protein [Candidatus Aminicenantes bacterium]
MAGSLVILIPLAFSGETANLWQSRGIISGKVFDARSGAPIEKAVIEIEPGSAAEDDELITLPVSTDSSGSFEITSLYDVVILTIKAEGYAVKRCVVRFTKSDRIVQDFHLQPEAIIRGVVTDEQTGIPIQEANITITERTDSGVEIKTVVSDEEGTFEARGLNEGAKEVIIRAHGYGCQVQQLDVKLGELVSNLFVSLPQAVEIEGVVKDESNIPIAGAEIKVSYLDKIKSSLKIDWHSGRKTTVNDGVFFIRNINPHKKLLIEVHHPDYQPCSLGVLALRPAEKLTNMDITLVKK